MRLTSLAALFLSSTLLLADAARDQKWRDDLNTIATQLPARHINFYTNVSRADFSAAIAQLDAAIPSLTDPQVVTGFARIVAMARDAHTNINLPQSVFPMRRVPLRLQWLDDGLFVVGASAENAKAVGTRVVSIGGMPIAQAYQAVSTLIGHENEAWLQYLTPNYLVNTDVLEALHVISDPAKAAFVFQDLSGATFTMEIAATTSPSITVTAPDAATGFTPLYRQNPALNYWFTYLPAGAMYFKYNRCVEMSSQPFAQFAQSMLATFDQNPALVFVADLRGNTGGDSSIITPLVNGLRQRAARFGSSTRLVVFIDQGTISSGLMAAEALRDLQFAALYGAPTGGDPNHFGNISTLALPNSQISINYSTKQFTYPVSTDSLLPDVAVPLRSADYFARFDPVLAATFTAPGGRSSPTKIAVLNAASFVDALAPGTLATAFGDFPGVTATDATSLPYAKSLGGVEVRVNGVASPVLAVRASQINFQIPRAVALGSAEIRVLRGGVEIARDTFFIGESAPGIFVVSSTDISRPGAVLNQDFRLNSAAVRAKRGDVIQIFATGQGATDPPVEDGAAGGASLSFAKLETHAVLGVDAADAVFSGLSPQFPGVWQVNLRVPDTAASGQVPIYLYAGSKVSNAVTVWIE